MRLLLRGVFGASEEARVEENGFGKQRTIGQNASAGDGGAELDVAPHEYSDDGH